MAVEGQGMKGDLLVFISYRRQDTSGYAGRLYDALVRRFRPDQLFMDVDAIPPGVDFAEYIQSAVGRCDALLALIGPGWMVPDPETGKPRLEDPHDYVRLEIEAALDRQVRVIPILLQGARLPRAEDLPESLRPLLRRNALDMSDGRWRFDADRLIEVLEGLETVKTGATRPSGSSPLAGLAELIRRQPLVGVAIGAAAALVLLLGVGMSGVLGGPGASPSATTGAVVTPSRSSEASATASGSTAPSDGPASSDSPAPSLPPSSGVPSLPPIIADDALTPEEEELASRIGSDVLYQGADRICVRAIQEGPSAAVVCTFDPGGSFNRVHYWLYPTIDAVKAAYRTWRPTAPVEGQGCAVGIPGESTYRVGTEVAGTLGCFESPNETEGIVFVWSNERVRVLSFVVANPGTTMEDVFNFWRDRAGPFG